MVTPGENIMRLQQQELQSAKGKAIELRRQLEQVSKELAVCKQQLGATQKALHNAELAKGTHQEYSRKMEQQLEKSGKGVALLKAAKLQSELEFLQKENNVLFNDLQAKGQEVKSLVVEVSRQRDLVDQAAQHVGLPSRQLLEELVELRQQVSSMSDALMEKEAIVNRQQLDLQDFGLYRTQYQAVEGRVRDLEVALDTVDNDKSTLLDFIQDMQSAEARLVSDRDGATASAAASAARASRAESKVEELQRLVKEQLGLMHAAQAQCGALEKEVAAGRRERAVQEEQRAGLLADHQASVKQQMVVVQELQRMHELLQGVVDPSDTHSAELDGAINHLTHRAMTAMSPQAQHTTRNKKATQGPAGAGANSNSNEVVTSLSSVSRQLEVLVSQHTQLQTAWCKAGGMQRDNDKLRQQLLDQESQLAAAAGRLSQLEGELAACDSQWRRLSRVLRDGPGDGGRPTEAHVPGREHELVAAVEARLHAGRQALSTALSQVASVREECAGLQAALTQAGEERAGLAAGAAAATEERVARTAQVKALKEELRATRSALESRPAAEDMAALVSRASGLQAQLEAAHHQMSALMAAHASELRNVEHAHSSTQCEASSLAQQLQQSRLEGEQLALRAAAAQEALVQQEEDLLRYKAMHVKHLLRAPPHAHRDHPPQGPSVADMLAAAAADAHTAAAGERLHLANMMIMAGSQGQGMVRHRVADRSSDDDDDEEDTAGSRPWGRGCGAGGTRPDVWRAADQAPAAHARHRASPAAPLPGKTAAAAWRVARAEPWSPGFEGDGEERDAVVVGRGRRDGGHYHHQNQQLQQQGAGVGRGQEGTRGGGRRRGGGRQQQRGRVSWWQRLSRPAAG